MSIQKKSLISTLKTAKKANVAKEEFAPTKLASKHMPAKQLAKLAGKSAAQVAPAKILAKIV